MSDSQQQYSLRDEFLTAWPHTRPASVTLNHYSPGAIPNTMTVDSLPYRRVGRNEAIISLLAKGTTPEKEREMGGRSAMMDKRGEVVQIILDDSERLSGKRPIYSLVDESELLLVIPALVPQP